MTETLDQCRCLLESLTPLSADCGALCGAVCCESHGGEETGMLLFPGEEAFYAGLADFRVLDTDRGKLLICSGRCRREQRPLSCRMFPLLPVIRDSGVKVAMDARCRAVCPLWRYGTRGLGADFVDAVRFCGELLLRSPEHRAFLERLTREHDDLIALQREFGRR